MIVFVSPTKLNSSAIPLIGLLTRMRPRYAIPKPSLNLKEDVFSKIGPPVVSNCLEGYNGTIFAYGQTGTEAMCSFDFVRLWKDLYHPRLP
jgi:hypothetical protein